MMYCWQVYHLWLIGSKLWAKIYVKKLWVITGMKYSVHLLDILTAATISPSAPCKLSSLGRAHHSTILAISVLKSTTMISRFGSKNAFPSSEKMINYVSWKTQSHIGFEIHNYAIFFLLRAAFEKNQRILMNWALKITLVLKLGV